MPVLHAAAVKVQVVVSLHTPPTQPIEQQSAATVHEVPATPQPPGT